MFDHWRRGRYSLVIIYGGEGFYSGMVLHVPMQWGENGSSFDSLWEDPSVVYLCFLVVWGLLGFTRASDWPFIWMEKPVGEAFVRYFEYNSIMFDVGYLAEV